ncbi:hypothetical protein SAMN05428642_103124 [Flaviramulus basaltis]|uniref:Uncharacterized protein n=1 Tax=Flaviramulus basaltis TaxID=369401 RepID=A0A1K2ILS9_9FLAO|nr:hypothetical protein [Flaviramulus basaltis]SFZ93421.1 hypothetical protein SAMN05428642_103124 [Flaviramulus basaltis]
MKAKILIPILFLTLSLFKVQSQKLTIQKETKVVLIVDKKTNIATNLADYSEIQDLMNSRKLLAKYPNSMFFPGIIKGSYVSSKTLLGLPIDTMLTIYNDKPLFSGDHFFLGDHFKITSREVSIMSSQKGELELKIIR